MNESIINLIVGFLAGMGIGLAIPVICFSNIRIKEAKRRVEQLESIHKKYNSSQIAEAQKAFDKLGT